jgi:hypothetical protein
MSTIEELGSFLSREADAASAKRNQPAPTALFGNGAATQGPAVAVVHAPTPGGGPQTESGANAG